MFYENGEGVNMSDTQIFQATKILRRNEVENITGLSRSTIYDKIKKGVFPRPIKLGERSVGWVSSDIQKWIQDMITQARG